MELSIQIPSELFTAFNDVTFYDEPHKYYHKKNELISVTTLIHKYQEEFNEIYWSEYKSNELNISPFEIKRAWSFINRKGTIKGSAIHNYAENLFLNKKYEYPKDLILNEFGFDPILKEYEITKKHVDNFYFNAQNKLIPIKTEFVLYDIENLVGGMLDMLFYNVKSKEFQIWDYKTNKNFTQFNKNGNKLLYELDILDDCDLNIYSLQLGIYKYIIEKYIPIKLGKSYLAWFSHNNDNYKVIECKDLSYYVNIIMNKRKLDVVK